MKGKMLIALLPVALVIFLVLIIISIIAAIFGNKDSVYRSSFVMPFDTNRYEITSDYGIREDPISKETKMHNGVDVVPYDTKNIVAIADGTVVVSDYQEGSSGEYVIIEHNISGKKYRSSYLHMELNSRVVKVGDKVKQGQQIGLMGSTGYSTGAHLHLCLQEYSEEKQKFEYTDPTTIITNKITSKEYNLYDYGNNKYQKEDYFNNKYELLDPNNKYELPSLNP